MAQANDPTPVASQPASPDLAAPSKTVAPLDPFAIEMLDILALNLSAHILAHIPPSQHAQAWKHFARSCWTRQKPATLRSDICTKM